MSVRGHRADAVRNSDKIVRAAIAALTETGAEVSLDDIAQRAGVGIATVYRRFGDRGGVIRASFEAYFTEEIEPLALAALSSGDPCRALAEALTATVDSLAARRRLFTAAKESGAITLDLAERFAGPLGEVLADAQLCGRIRSDLTVRDLGAIIVMALATVRHEGAAPAAHHRYLALLLDGIRPSRTPLPSPPGPGPAL